jgi:acyl-coenzyme A synthetase/AMP-(fatty) acid ligase|tara:strand:- start:3219 stop:4727 length:1509 start_codon:yes stop_codon:yes gene_type:complete
MKNNRIIKTIINNYQSDKKKIIFFDRFRKISWSDLINLSIKNSKILSKIDQKYIPIIVDRDVKTVIAICSVLFAGKVFCPISNQLPIKKINIILNKLNARYLINCSSKEIYSKKVIKFIYYSKQEDIKKINEFIISNMKLKNINESLYVLFTSGSTGEPKGVILSYENILNTLIWSKSYIKWNSKDIIGIATSFSFDISIFDLFSGLFFNVPMYILQNPSNAPSSLQEIINNKISSVFAVPSFFSNFVRYNSLNKKITSLKLILSGGDFFPHKDILTWKKYQQHIKIYNVWGPTETSIVNSMYKIKLKDIIKIQNNESLPVGKSHPRMQILILNNKKQIVDRNNVKGEIAMVGKSVSKGYIGHNDDKKSYITIKNKKSFLTGDIGYFDENNYLHIVGRKDNTIKISGYRIDAKEIENYTNQIKHIENSYAFSTQLFDNYNFLCLCIISNHNIKIEIIKRQLRKFLPEYSIPKYIFCLKKFPLNINGKIDRNNLQKKILRTFD